MVSRQFDFTQKSKGKFPFEEQFLFIQELGVAVGFELPLRSTVEMKRRLIEMMRLSCIPSIPDGALGCVHVARVKRRVDSSISWIFIERSRSILGSINCD